jgi:hypothetical protein
MRLLSRASSKSVAIDDGSKPSAADAGGVVASTPASVQHKPAAQPGSQPAADPAKIGKVREMVQDLPACINMPLDDACVSRYLLARNMDVDKAAAMLRATIEWRIKFGTDDIAKRMELIRTEGRTGKSFVAPFTDREGRPVLVLRPKMENTRSYEGNIVHLVYVLERISKLCRPAASKLFLFIDFKGYSMMNAPPMKTSIETLHILQNHYPERLGLAVLLDAPWLFSGAFKAMQPFIDPVTRAKISFLYTNTPAHMQTLDKLVELEHVEKDLGGKLATPHFDESSYFAPTFDPMQLELAARPAS